MRKGKVIEIGKALAAIAVSAGLLAGCGGQAQEKPEAATSGEAVTDQESAAPQEERAGFDWRKQEIQAPGAVAGEEPVLYYAEYVPYVRRDPHPEAEYVYSAYVRSGAKFYGRFRYGCWETEEQFAEKQYLFSLDAKSRETSFQPFEPDLKEAVKDWEGMLLVPVLCGASSGELVFAASEWSVGEEEELSEPLHYYVMHMDPQGKPVKTVDLGKEFIELGFMRASADPKVTQKCFVGGAGEYYVQDNESAMLYRMDGEGGVCPVLDYSRYGREAGLKSGRAWDDTLLFFLFDGERNATVIYDVQDGPAGDDAEKDDAEKNGTAREIGVIPELKAAALYVDETGYCYLAAKEKLYRWDMANGKLDYAFDLAEKGLDGENLLMGTDEEGRLWLYGTGDRAEAAYVLSAVEPAQEIKLRLVNTIETLDMVRGDFLKRCAADHTRRIPGGEIAYETVEYAQREAYMSRMMAEIAQGKGPDLMVVTPEEMRILWEKGALADVGELLSDETEELLWEAQREAGKIDGRLAGLALEGSGMSFMVRRDVWDKDTWTVAEFVELLERGLSDEGFFGVNFGYEISAEDMFSELLMRDIEYSPFVDVREGRSYFNGEEFKHALEVFKRLGERAKKDARAEQGGQGLLSGKYLAEGVQMIDLFHFSNRMAALEDQGVLVGYPTGSGRGNYFRADTLLVVNAASENREAISDFLEYVLSQESQKQDYYGLVRKDVLESCVAEDFYKDGKSPVFRAGNNVMIPLTPKGDGSSYLDEYIQWLDSCVPCPTEGEQIREIVRQEIPGYFQGERSAEEVAETVHNRVQLYLNEGR